MGKLVYDSEVTVDFEDRLLAHLQLVIGSKLRRGEGFYFSWRDDPAAGDGRSSIWVHPAHSLRFKYLGSKSIVINRAWVDVLTRAANSSAGLVIVPEPQESTS
ncbi:ATP-dependent DNA ligase [Agromyces atrinae]|uniref:DUF7882 family protein n=1 Tax=Agromyces atrinae TaxID=592376 RepID=UPI001F561705|nr:ATP-dependent DNA ligase [Agromyces atrinae]MCI2959470.1 ATP-dependent DNA ligase [Agromyces atrinae]